MEQGYCGLLEHVAEIDERGDVHVHRINRGAGLGGHPYRDGSYTYYIQEDIVTDDPKGVAPFIMACVGGELAGW